ncbi:25S rRNA adenine-N(1) methyltransferase [Salix suchowensis]|nr:25S rRNA adenine-N(1) methyltransferase [Salix suchowensis]
MHTHQTESNRCVHHDEDLYRLRLECLPLASGDSSTIRLPHLRSESNTSGLDLQTAGIIRLRCHTTSTMHTMDDFTFSAVTAVFTIGGLLGSVVANLVTDKYGRKGATRASALLVALGTAFMTVAGSVGVIAFGRYRSLLVGMGSGIGLCVGPIYLSEIAPPSISGNVGVLTQLSIVLGIMITQLLGINLATPTTWRLVLFASCALSIFQLLTSAIACETPTYLGGKGLHEEKRAVSQRLWGTASNIARVGATDAASPSTTIFDEEGGRADSSVKDPLLSVNEVEDDEAASNDRLPRHDVAAGFWNKRWYVQTSGLLALESLWRPIVLYYSNDILSKALPDFGPYISLGITVVNVLMTFPPIVLIEVCYTQAPKVREQKMGRRPLLSVSTGGAIVSLLAVGYGLDSNYVALSSIAIITFVMYVSQLGSGRILTCNRSFAIGLGPVPFVMIPEVSPFYAVSALSSTGLSLNCTNFISARALSIDLPFNRDSQFPRRPHLLALRNFLSGASHDKDGRVFYLFAFILALSMGALSRVYRG